MMVVHREFSIAGESMEDAKEYWNPSLGIAKPAFTSHEMDLIDSTRLRVLGNKFRGFFRN